jgi:hypothetical protein
MLGIFRHAGSRDELFSIGAVHTDIRAVTKMVSSLVARLLVYLAPLVDTGFGLIYDRERNLSWLRDANYAKTLGLTPDGQMSWNAAISWVARLSYAGVHGWRLPTAFNDDGSGPDIGQNCTRTELGRLLTANQGLAGSVSAENFYPFSIYWTSTEASENEAFAFRLTGLRQGKLAKNPFAPDPVLGGAVPLTDLVLVWPVHDGDVAAEIKGRWSTFLLRPVALLLHRRVAP